MEDNVVLAIVATVRDEIRTVGTSLTSILERIEEQVDTNTKRIDNLESWKTWLLGACAAVTFIGGGTLAVAKFIHWLWGFQN